MIRFKTRLKPAPLLIDLTPLVDVVFLLLIFFIVTSDVLPLKSLPIQNPALALPALPLTTQLPILIDRHRTLYIGTEKKVTDLVSLEDELKIEVARLQQLNGGLPPTLVLSLDKNVEYDLFLRTFAIAQKYSSRLRLAYDEISLDE